MSFYNAALGGRRSGWDEGDRMYASIGGFGWNPDDTKIHTQLMQSDCEDSLMPVDDSQMPVDDDGDHRDPLELTEEDIQKLWETGDQDKLDRLKNVVEEENRRLGLRFRHEVQQTAEQQPEQPVESPVDQSAGSAQAVQDALDAALKFYVNEAATPDEIGDAALEFFVNKASAPDEFGDEVQQTTQQLVDVDSDGDQSFLAFLDEKVETGQDEFHEPELEDHEVQQTGQTAEMAEPEPEQNAELLPGYLLAEKIAAATAAAVQAHLEGREWQQRADHYPGLATRRDRCNDRDLAIDDGYLWIPSPSGGIGPIGCPKSEMCTGPGMCPLDEESPELYLWHRKFCKFWRCPYETDPDLEVCDFNTPKRQNPRQNCEADDTPSFEKPIFTVTKNPEKRAEKPKQLAKKWQFGPKELKKLPKVPVFEDSLIRAQVEPKIASRTPQRSSSTSLLAQHARSRLAALSVTCHDSESDYTDTVPDSASDVEETLEESGWTESQMWPDETLLACFRKFASDGNDDYDGPSRKRMHDDESDSNDGDDDKSDNVDTKGKVQTRKSKRSRTVIQCQKTQKTGKTSTTTTRTKSTVSTTSEAGAIAPKEPNDSAQKVKNSLKKVKTDTKPLLPNLKKAATKATKAKEDKSSKLKTAKYASQISKESKVAKTRR